jgi:hypothetical protein
LRYAATCSTATTCSAGWARTDVPSQAMMIPNSASRIFQKQRKY